jgi:Protein of unknown function DUF86
MPSETTIGPLTYMRENISLALAFIGTASLDQFLADRRTVYAVTRCLEIISEASRRLPPELKARHPHIRWQAWREPAMCTVTIMSSSSTEQFGIPCRRASDRCSPSLRKKFADWKSRSSEQRLS